MYNLDDKVYFYDAAGKSKTTGWRGPGTVTGFSPNSKIVTIMYGGQRYMRHVSKVRCYSDLTLSTDPTNSPLTADDDAITEIPRPASVTRLPVEPPMQVHPPLNALPDDPALQPADNLDLQPAADPAQQAVQDLPVAVLTDDRSPDTVRVGR